MPRRTGSSAFADDDNGKKQKARRQIASGLFYSEADRKIPVRPW
jgi:hypothetical protein